MLGFESPGFALPCGNRLVRLGYRPQTSLKNAPSLADNRVALGAAQEGLSERELLPILLREVHTIPLSRSKKRKEKPGLRDHGPHASGFVDGSPRDLRPGRPEPRPSGMELGADPASAGEEDHVHYPDVRDEGTWLAVASRAPTSQGATDNGGFATEETCARVLPKPARTLQAPGRGAEGGEPSYQLASVLVDLLEVNISN